MAVAFRWQFSRLVLRLAKRLIWPGLARWVRRSFFVEGFGFPIALAVCIIDSCCGIIWFKTLNVVATWAVFPSLSPLFFPVSQFPSFPNSITILFGALAIFWPRHCLRLLSFIFCLAYFWKHLPTQRLALNLSSNFLFCFCARCCSCHVMNVEICWDFAEVFWRDTIEYRPVTGDNLGF